MKYIYLITFFGWCISISSQELIVPEMMDELPSAGKRVKVIPIEYEGTDVYYSLYLPENFNSKKKYPVIVEYTGNYWPPSGSTGEVKDANLGFVVSQELNAIWVVMPYVEGKESIVKWWGNEDEIIEFALKNIRRVC